MKFVRDVLMKNLENPNWTVKGWPPQATLAKTSEIIASTNSNQERQEIIEMQTIATVEENLDTFLEESTQTELALGPGGSLQFCE